MAIDCLKPAAARRVVRRSAAAESVEKFGISMTVLGNVGVTVETASMVTRLGAAGVAPGELHGW